MRITICARCGWSGPGHTIARCRDRILLAFKDVARDGVSACRQRYVTMDVLAVNFPPAAKKERDRG